VTLIAIVLVNNMVGYFNSLNLNCEFHEWFIKIRRKDFLTDLQIPKFNWVS
jgi:hypothetical protein